MDSLEVAEYIGANRDAFKTRWVAALRSGEYKQGKKALTCQGTFCCLGVAADLLVKEGRGAWSENGAFQIDHQQWGTYLPGHIGAALKLHAISTDTEGGPFYGQGALAVLNDDQRKTFSEIADLIEATIGE